MKNILLYVCICLVWGGCAVHENKLIQCEVSDIVVDPDRMISDLDISDVLTDTVEIIKLETNEECLIGEIGKVSFTDKFVFVSDPGVARKLFMFDRTGKFIRTIGRQGNGPGEYAVLGNFIISGDSLFIQDYYKDKYLVYQISKNRFVSDVPYIPHHHSAFVYQNIFYMVSRYFPSKYGCYNLYKFDIKRNRMDFALPFSQEIAVSQRAWSIEQQVCKVKNHSFVFYPLNDTIYRIDKNVYPAYTLTFLKRTIPQNIIQGCSGSEIMDYAFQHDCVRGPIHLQHSDEWMLATYVDGNEYRYMLIDKGTKEYRISKTMGIRKEGGLTIPHNYLIEDNYFISWLPVNFLKMWRTTFDSAVFSDEIKKEGWGNLIDSLKEEDNLVIIRCKIKEK